LWKVTKSKEKRTHAVTQTISGHWSAHGREKGVTLKTRKARKLIKTGQLKDKLKSCDHKKTGQLKNKLKSWDLAKWSAQKETCKE